MNRPQRSALLTMLAQALKDHGSWAGETHVQKAAFLLQEAAGVPMGYDFILYKHGPFAFDLRSDLQNLRADGLLDIETQPYPYGPSIITTSRTPVFQAHYPKTLAKYGPLLAKVADLIGPKGVVSLERLATAFLIMKRNPEFDDEEVAAELRRVKPHITVEAAVEAVATARAKVEPLVASA